MLPLGMELGAVLDYVPPKPLYVYGFAPGGPWTAAG